MWVYLNLVLRNVTENNTVFDDDTRAYFEDAEHVFALNSDTD